MENKVVEIQNNNEGNEQPAKQKRGLIGTIKHVRDTVMANKAGRIIVKGLKLATGGLIVVEAYKKGQKSVKPVTVYVQELPSESKEDNPAETEEEKTEE